MNGLRDTAQLRSLAGSPRPIDDLVAELHAAAVRLDCLTGRWLIFAPRPETLSEVETCIEGVRRLLVEIRAKLAEVDDAA